MSGDSKLVSQIEASVDRALGEKMRATWQVDLDEALPQEWLELIAKIEAAAQSV